MKVKPLTVGVKNAGAEVPRVTGGDINSMESSPRSGDCSILAAAGQGH